MPGAYLCYGHWIGPGAQGVYYDPTVCQERQGVREACGLSLRCLGDGRVAILYRGQAAAPTRVPVARMT
jgi:hypothetical protein